MIRHSVIVTAALLTAVPALAQSRPSDEDIFGGAPAPPAQPTPGTVTPRPNKGKTSGGTTAASDPSAMVVPLVKEDPLKIGGLIYLRTVGQWQKDIPPSQWSLSAPALVDGYLDVRPNDRVRGFLLARLQYDLSRAKSSGTVTSITPSDLTNSSFLQSENPSLLLDQLWVKFDIEHVAFITAGRQHVKWGTSHFWNPTDFLHPVRRDPLAAFDARTGTTMLKVHLPWEKRGWNFYGMAVLDESQPAGLLGQVGAAARAEVVVATVEIGIDGLVQRGKDARLGVDFSAGIWDLDFYGEAALRNGSDIPLWRPTTGSGTPSALFPGYERFAPTDFRPAATLGVNWSLKYSDEDSLTLGVETFYNGAGYSDSKVYPVLLAQEAIDSVSYFMPFYLGKYYAGAYLSLPKPGSWNDTTFTLSGIENISDRSYVARLDSNVLLLTYLTLEAYVAGRLGQMGGEFRFGTQMTLASPANVSFKVPAPVLDFGLALRVSL